MLIISKPPPGKIDYACETIVEGARWMDICRIHEGDRVSHEWVEMPQSDRPLYQIFNPGGDIDETYLRDIIQSLYGRPAAERLDRPNITELYHDFVEQRAAEHKGQRHFAMEETS